MKPYLQKTIRYFLRFLLMLMMLFVLQVSLLAYPYVWFDHSFTEGSLTLHYDDPISLNIESLALDVSNRIKATELYDPELELDVMLCSEQEKYDRFARLSFVPVTVPGFNLSVFDNSYISMEKLAQRRSNNYANLRYAAMAGDLAQSIAHELTHNYVVKHDGLLRSRKIPRWKSEGYAEYQASKAFSQIDSVYTLQKRYSQIDDIYDQHSRDYYRWSLVVEFLASELGYSYTDIMHDSVTYEGAGAKLGDWVDGE